MTQQVEKLLEAVALLGTAACLVYYGICLWSALRFLFERRKHFVKDASFRPAISILKPLKGMDPEIEQSLRSHCIQEYPVYEIIFGVSDLQDPAVPLVRQLQQEFPRSTSSSVSRHSEPTSR